jgi:hypothetical protein
MYAASAWQHPETGTGLGAIGTCSCQLSVAWVEGTHHLALGQIGKRQTQKATGRQVYDAAGFVKWLKSASKHHNTFLTCQACSNGAQALHGPSAAQPITSTAPSCYSCHHHGCRSCTLHEYAGYDASHANMPRQINLEACSEQPHDTIGRLTAKYCMKIMVPMMQLSQEVVCSLSSS